MNTTHHRNESIIFNELAELCSQSGYVHAIAFFCFRDNTAFIQEKLTPEIIIEQYNPESLIRSEISTLVGLLIKNKINLTLPDQDSLEKMISQTEILLNELHQVLSIPIRSYFENIESDKSKNPFSAGSVLREAIFYNGESAYDFQYLDFSIEKYKADNDWLISNKGFSINDASKVIQCIIDLHCLKLQNHLLNLKGKHPRDWTMLPAFIFTLDELINELVIDPKTIENIVMAFSIPGQNKNEGFTNLSDFNITNAAPLIPLDNNQYLLFQHYSLVEALYESPFYWMNGDKKYSNKARENRGNFVEKFSAEKLKKVFGKERVFSNIDIYDPKKPNKGDRCEIDVLVVFGDRVIILQAKSKRLTIEARKGNDNIIKQDFSNSIQDAYNQAHLCAKLFSDEKYVLVDSNSNTINVNRKCSEIYIFCVIPDHYPALSFQSRQFLKWEVSDNIKPPFVMDIFYLDVMVEMLHSPIYFLSYINRRTSYIDKILAPHEITTLSFFMKHNPWLNRDEFICLEDNISSDIDSAMMVRRIGGKGKKIPDGVFALLMSGKIGNILNTIGKSENPVAIDLGFLFLTLGKDSIAKIENGINKILKKFKKDFCSSDMSISIDENETGLTIHVNNRPDQEAMDHLKIHCEMRKYIQKAKSWYGLSINPNGNDIRFAIKIAYPWEHLKQMDTCVKQNLLNSKLSKGSEKRKRNKIGVNERCPCGSGLKYKKCCKI